LKKIKYKLFSKNTKYFSTYKNYSFPALMDLWFLLHLARATGQWIIEGDKNTGPGLQPTSQFSGY